jgi:hypothetical protein
VTLVKRYSATVYPRPFCLEKPLDLYTGRELEHLILRWQKARACWILTRYQDIPILRQFSSPQKSPNCVHLVEGGRWLLVGMTSGSVVYYDLNSPKIVPVTLVPMPFDYEEPTEILLSVDMDLDSEYLKFNLGIITRRMPDGTNLEPTQSPRYFRFIQIWQVTSNVDSKTGEAQGLQAEQLACFPEEHRNYCASFRIRGRHVAYTLITYYQFSDFRDGPCASLSTGHCVIRVR